MIALVTGATGFIGSHLVDRLETLGFQIRCTFRSKSKIHRFSAKNIQPFLVNFETGEGLDEALKGADYVFHLAGATKALNLDEYHRSNVIATERLLEGITRHAPDLKRLIYLSSQAAAGPATQGKPLDETAECSPVTHYGESKRIAEQRLDDYPMIPWVTLRASAVYGPGDRDFLTIIKSMNHGFVPILGKRDKRLTFVHVDDVVTALIAVTKKDQTIGQTYFVTDGNIYTFTEVRRIIEGVLNRKTRELPVPLPVLWLAAFVSELRARIWRTPTILNLNRFKEFTLDDWSCSSEKLQKEVGFRPQYTLAAGIRQTVAWAAKQGWL